MILSNIMEISKGWREKGGYLLMCLIDVLGIVRVNKNELFPFNVRVKKGEVEWDD